MNRLRRRAQPRDAGFTLVELIIALALIALITVLLFGGLRLGARTWDSVERVTERVTDVRGTLSLLAGLLRQSRDLAAPLPEDGGEVKVFAGDAERLEWIAPLAEQVGVPGLYVLRLTLEEAGEHRRLVLTRWLLHPDVLAGGEDFPAWKPLVEADDTPADAGPLDLDRAGGAYGRTVLLPAVERFSLRYFGVAPGTSEGEWLEEWLDQPAPPERVLLELAAPGQPWPTVLVRLPAAAGEFNAPPS